MQVGVCIQPGQRLLFEVWRDGQPGRLTVTLGEAGKAASPPPVPRADTQALSLLGLQLRPLQPVEHLAIGSAAGLLVEAANGPAQAAGMQARDVVLSINGKPVASLDQARAAVKGAGSTVALLVQRGGEKLFVPISQSAPSR